MNFIRRLHWVDKLCIGLVVVACVAAYFIIRAGDRLEAKQVARYNEIASRPEIKNFMLACLPHEPIGTCRSRALEFFQVSN